MKLNVRLKACGLCAVARLLVGGRNAIAANAIASGDWSAAGTSWTAARSGRRVA